MNLVVGVIGVFVEGLLGFRYEEGLNLQSIVVVAAAAKYGVGDMTVDVIHHHLLVEF